MIFSKIKESFKKTKENLDLKLSNIFNSSKNIEEILDEVEETFILSDMGVATSTLICDNVREKIKKEKNKDKENVLKLLKEEMIEVLSKYQENTDTKTKDENFKKIILVVGVNGVGKTTSIGKIANKYVKENKKVLLVAADTFRAGAIEQLKIWSSRAKTDIYCGKEQEDPSSVAYEGSKEFVDKNYDVMICDTAGRLHNKKNLMDELEKIKRTILKNVKDIEDVLIEVYMVIDATTGQNAISQITNFYDRTSIDGIILTKLDSTAKGGVIFSIVNEFKIPVKYIGVGEKIDDIEEFRISDFVNSII